MSLNRRTFLRRAAALTLPWYVPARALGRDGAVAPSERIALGVIGIGPRCRYVLSRFLPETDVQCVAVCDVQADRLAAAKAQVDQRYGNRDCATHRDLRELLARPDIDAVLIGTGDRWHTPATVLAAKAGKDVYSEKPCCLTMAECKLLDDTVRRYGRVFQAGTQRRSNGNFQLAAELARGGQLGALKLLEASIYHLRVLYDWLPAQPEPPKEVVDWDLWLGPSPWRPYNAAYVRGGWRAYYDFDSGATLLDWGAHTVDLCQWANRADETTPVEYEPLGAEIHARYANGVKLALHQRLPARLGTCPVRYEGDEGWVQTGDNGTIEVSSEALRGELRRLKWARRVGTDPGNHARNFLDCVRSRALPNCHSGSMRRSHLACHAAALAWMLKRKLTFDPVTEAFVGDEEANRLRSRAAREPWCL